MAMPEDDDDIGQFLFCGQVEINLSLIRWTADQIGVSIKKRRYT